VADGSDFNGFGVFQIEKEPVITPAETEAGERRLKFFYIFRAGNNKGTLSA
jgi:hypothetical protein